MSRRDRINNEKVITFFYPAARSNGTHQSGVFDLQQGGSGEGPGRELPTNILFMVMIGSWGGGATIVPTILTGDTSTVTAYATVAAMSQAEGARPTYIWQITDLQRYIQLQLVLSGNTTLAAVGTANRSRREPAIQDALSKAVTYSRSPATG
jgi:hypothetical protein